MESGKGPRVLHLPTAVGGNAWGLAQGERALGARSDVLVVEGGRTTITYPNHRRVDLAEHPSRAGKFARLGREFLRIRNRYDVFHFNYGQSLFHFPDRGLVQADLPFYPRKARLFATFNGCDVRQKDVTARMRPIAPCHNPACLGGACNSGELDNKRRAGAAKMAQYAQHLWAMNPDLLKFLPPEKSSFLPYSVADHDSLTPTFSDPGTKRLRVLHAPSDRIVKGTDWVMRAFEKLPKDQFELVLVENMPRTKAIELYRTADLVIDQLLIGWYGALAVEAMRLGKPVLFRLDLDDVALIPPKMALALREAVIEANPAQLAEVLQGVHDDRKLLAAKAHAGYEFASKWHDPKYVASLTLEQYERRS